MTNISTCVCACCMLSHFSCVQLCDTLWTVARQAPLPVGFSRQEHYSRLPCPLLGGLPDPGMEPESLASLAMAGGFLTTSTTWEAHFQWPLILLEKSLQQECLSLWLRDTFTLHKKTNYPEETTLMRGLWSTWLGCFEDKWAIICKRPF